jgi:hypothetical protein
VRFRSLALVALLAGVAALALWSRPACACSPVISSGPNDISAASVFPRIAAAEESVHKAQSHYARGLPELSGVSLARNTLILSASGSADSYQVIVRVDSVAAERKECLLSGPAPPRDDSVRFTVSCETKK